jgi:hypothetical protein
MSIGSTLKIKTSLRGRKIISFEKKSERINLCVLMKGRSNPADKSALIVEIASAFHFEA